MFVEMIRRVGRRIDRAITLGVSAMYPIVFSLPAPDPPPDWKQVVRVGWKVVRVVLTEAARRWSTLTGQEGPPIDLKSFPNVPTAWTSEERIDVATVLLGMIQLDIPGGRYSTIDRPNITSVIHVLHEPAEVLNEPQARASLARMLVEAGR